MTTAPTSTSLAQQKLAAFERIRPEFEASFRFVQDVHGQQRFATFPVHETVHYLHALWVCECKDRLLSVYKNITRYEGTRCLMLLQHWQTGENAEVIDFLQQKLDGMPFAELTRQIEAVQRARQPDGHTVRRLVHGRSILLNRGMNLMQALDAIFLLAESDLREAVQAACVSYGHRPDQLEQQLVAMADPLYAYAPHQNLARLNMQLMNALGMTVMSAPGDLPGTRSERVLAPLRHSHQPFAEHMVAGYVELIAPYYNNLRGHRFFDRVESSANPSG